jgi:hypothetical protein
MDRLQSGSHLARWRRAASVLVSGIVVGAGLVAATAVSSAASPSCTTSWANKQGGDWATASNWTHGAPNSATDACITLPGTYTVTVQSFDNSVRSLTLGGTDGSQTLAIEGDCSSSAFLQLSGDSFIGINGLVNVGSNGCSTAELSNLGSVLTNDGQITTLPGSYSFLSGDLVNNAFVNVEASAQVDGGTWTNAGTISVADGTSLLFEDGATLANDKLIAAEGSGTLSFPYRATYTQGAGRLTGPEPVTIEGGRVNYVGGGKGTVAIRGYGSSVSGNVGPHQTLDVSSDCNDGAELTAFGSWTNRGAILLRASCYWNADLITQGTLTNRGTITTTGSRYHNDAGLFGVFVNHGTLSIGAGSFVEPDGLTNASDGTIGVELASPSLFGQIGVFYPPTISLDGTLSLSTRGPYWPRAGTTFAIIAHDEGNLTGKFAKVTGRTKAGQSVKLSVHYLDFEVNVDAT